MIGKTVNHYKIREKLGEGAMGEVYLAEDTKLDRKVAIKFLPQHLTGDQKNVQRFKREAKAAAALNHPNIITIHDISEYDGQIFIVMEHVDGKSLREILDEYKLRLDKIIDILSQISEGLSQAHEAGIVHRDLKPENIIVGRDGRVRILDFGLAKLKGVSKLTKETSTLGTIQYMSPEQILARGVDQRSDIWSLGVVLYEMLTGETPFKGEYEQSVIYAILNKKSRPLKPSISSRLHPIIEKCLQKKQSMRYQNVDELIADLRGLQNKPLSILTESDNKKKKSYSILYPILMISSVIIIVSGYFLVQHTEKETPGWENSIAVLPFDDLSPENDQEWFCDGMTEQIISNLAKLTKLKVISRTSVMKYKETDKTISEIGKELAVAHVLEGSIRKFGNRIRVTAQLIETAKESHIWVEDFDSEYKELFTVQDQVSKAIASNLISNITQQNITDIKTNRTRNTESYEFYMKGRYFHFSKFGPTMKKEYFDTSEQMFLKAIQLDSNYALAYAGLADLYHSFSRIAKNEKQKYLELVNNNIKKAYNLDQTSAYINRVKGSLYKERGDIDSSFYWYKRAYSLDPNSHDSNYELGAFYYRRGLINLAIKYTTTAIEIDPLSIELYLNRGICYYILAQFEQAESDLRKALEIEPKYLGGLEALSELLIVLRRYEEAEKLLKQKDEHYPDRKQNWQQALIYALKGQKELALNIINRSEKLSDAIYTLLSMNDKALRILNNWSMWTLQNKRSYFYFLKYNPLYDNIRSDPSFQEILAKHKELYEENLNKYGDVGFGIRN